MLQTLQTINKERVVSIKELQKSPSRHLKNITRILRGKQTLGYFLDQNAFERLIEDLEALSNPAYILSIHKSRQRNKLHSYKDVAKRYGV